LVVLSVFSKVFRFKTKVSMDYRANQLRI